MSEEVSVKEAIRADERCARCNAEVRAESLYCYNCGGKVADGNTHEVSGIPITRRTENGAALPKTRSRRVHRAAKDVEVVWKRSDGPGFALLFIALGIAVFVSIVVAIAYYVK